MPKRAHRRFINKFFQKGVDILEVTRDNLDLYYYLMSIRKNGFIFKIVDTYVLIASNSGIGVTILTIPKKYYKNHRGESYAERGSTEDSYAFRKYKAH